MFGAGIATGVAFPLIAEVAQRAAQRSGRGQTLRRQFKRKFVQFGQMAHFATADGYLRHQSRGVCQQGADRRRLPLGQLPVAIQRAAGLFDQADALGHHHQAGWRRRDACGRQRQWLAGHIGFRERQKTAHAVIEDQHRVAALDFDAAAPLVDEAAQLVIATQLDQSALFQPAPQCQQRGIGSIAAIRGKQHGQATPGFRRVYQP